MALKQDQEYRDNDPNNCDSSDCKTEPYIARQRADKFDEKHQG